MALINSLSNLASVVFNGATVESNSVETVLLLAPVLLKSVDKLTAYVGETLTYTVTVTNAGLSALTNLPFSDVLPNGCSYEVGSFTVNASPATPVVTGNTLTYTIPSIAALGLATISFQALVTGGEI